ncbi:MAG: LytR family transcriptional regulator [Lachnospiraceae bacterium]|nr:LytR family transcriptional regulator [Lachnospiraceae bacterium]
MKYNDRYDEDEIDRMRARRQHKQQRTSSRHYHTSDDFEIIEDLDSLRSHRKDLTNKTSVKKKKRTKHKKRGWVLGILFLLLLLPAFLWWKYSHNNGYWTVAIYGVDSRDGKLGKGALADVQILCSINRKTGEIRLASVFRDTYLKIDQEGNYHKINEAYFRGGREQAGEALKENLDLHIEDYATFNWKAVADAINILGGIDLEITDQEFAYINSFITETVDSTEIGSVHLEHSGMNHLDGVQAVAYARLRLMDTDFNRTERQRKVMGLAMEKAKNADFETLRILVGTVFPQISTSIGVDDLMIMAKDVKKYYIGQTTGFPFSHTEMKIEKRDCVIPTTLESNVIQLHAFLYDDTQFSPSGVVKNISAHIAKVSGMDTPGKDTESGRNVGAEGNSGSQPNNLPDPGEAMPDEPMAEETTSSETVTEATETEANIPEGTTSGESSDIADMEPITDNEEEPSSTDTPGEAVIPSREPASPGGPETSSGNENQGPGANHSDEPDRSTNAALEAPGQGNGSNGPVSGPGA